MNYTAPRFLRCTNVTPEDIDRPSPADELMPYAAERWIRCIDINAPTSHVYRWLCQLTIAPYSYDWIDNLGRRSPNSLTAGAEELTFEQPFLIFSVTSFQPGHHIAGRSRPEFRRTYGDITVSYQVMPGSLDTSRLQVNACLARSTHPVIRTVLAVGDKIMAGRQLVNLRTLAERAS